MQPMERTVGKLTLEIEPGRNIDAACKKAQSVADQTGFTVEFKFNGVLCVAQPGGSAAELAQRQQEAQAAVPTVYSLEGSR